MDPDIEALIHQFESIRQDAESLTAGLTTSQLLRKPGANQWSIAECFAHLVMVDGIDVPGLRKAIETAHTQGIQGRGPFRYGLISGCFVKSMDAPVKRLKVRAPGAYIPAPVTDPRLTVGEFFRIQSEVCDLVRSADGVDLARVKVRLPIGPGLKMSLGRRFQLIAAHDRRHLWQARQVVDVKP